MGDSSSPQSQHQVVITATNKTPLIEIVTYLTLSIAVLSLGARCLTKSIQAGGLKMDDYLATASLTAALGQSIAVLVQCAHGWGTPLHSLASDQASRVFEAGYAADILFIASLGLAKISFIITVSTLTQRGHKYVVWALHGFIGLWAVSAIFTVLFQCHLPTPWDYVGRTCIDRSIFWTYFSILNIVTDVAAIALTMESIRRIQTSWYKKTVVMSVFGSRIFVLPAIVAQIITSRNALTSSDPTLDMWSTSILIQVVQCLSIFTACVPILKPFLDSLESGQLRADHLRRHGRTGYGYHSEGRGGVYGSNQHSGSGRKGYQKDASVDVLSSATPSHRSKVHELVDMGKHRRGTAQATSDPNPSWDGQSHTSQKGLIQIQQTWDVEVERRASVTTAEEMRGARQ